MLELTIFSSLIEEQALPNSQQPNKVKDS